MSTHYEERMEADLGEIRRKVKTVSDLVERQVQMAVQSLLHVDRDLASHVVLGDRQVNRRIKQIDHLCHAFIVRHAPSAGHLRYVSAVLRLDVALERVVLLYVARGTLLADVVHQKIAQVRIVIDDQHPHAGTPDATCTA